jgi:hypothetical protein
MHKSLAGGAYVILEHLAELFVNELAHIQSVIVHIVFHHPQDHHTQGAFVLEPAVHSCGLGEVGIGAAALHGCDLLHYRLEVLLPVAASSCLHDSVEEVGTVYG